MKTWRDMLHPWLSWWGFPVHSEPATADSAALLMEEIQAHLELMLYTATQAVAHAKMLDREIRKRQQSQKWNSQEAAQLQRLSAEGSAVRNEVEHLRGSIEQIHQDLKALQSQEALARSRTAFDDSSQILKEVGNLYDGEQTHFPRDDC